LPELATTYLPELATTYLPELATTHLPELATTYLPELATTYLPELATTYLPELATTLPKLPSLPKLATAESNIATETRATDICPRRNRGHIKRTANILRPNDRSWTVGPKRIVHTATTETTTTCTATDATSNPTLYPTTNSTLNSASDTASLKKSPALDATTNSALDTTLARAGRCRVRGGHGQSTNSALDTTLARSALITLSDNKRGRTKRSRLWRPRGHGRPESLRR
jgi:hypothetical protein